MEWLEEVAEEPWTDKDFQHHWKLVSQISLPKKEFKEALMEPVGKKVEEQDAAMAECAAVGKRVREPEERVWELEERVRKAWQKKKGDEKKGKELRDKVEQEIEEMNAKAEEATELQCRVWVMRGQHGKRPHKVPLVETRLPAEEQMAATRTAGELPLHCFSVAVTETTGRRVMKKDVAKKTKGPAPKPCPMRVLIVDPEGSKAAQTLQQDLEKCGAAAQLVTGKVTRRDRCVYMALKSAAWFARVGPPS